MTRKQVTFLISFIAERALRWLMYRLAAGLIALNEASHYCTEYLFHKLIYGSKLGKIQFNLDDERYPPDGVLWVRYQDRGTNLTPIPFRLSNRWVMRRTQRSTESLDFLVSSAAIKMDMRPVRVEWGLDAKSIQQRLDDAWKKIDDYLLETR